MGVSKMLPVLILLLLTFAGGTLGAEPVDGTPEVKQGSTGWSTGLQVAQFLLAASAFATKDWSKESPWVDGTKCWSSKEDRHKICTIEKTCINGVFTKGAWFYGEYYCCYNKETLQAKGWSLDDGS